LAFPNNKLPLGLLLLSLPALGIYLPNPVNKLVPSPVLSVLGSAIGNEGCSIFFDAVLVSYSFGYCFYYFFGNCYLISLGNLSLLFCYCSFLFENNNGIWLVVAETGCLLCNYYISFAGLGCVCFFDIFVNSGYNFVIDIPAVPSTIDSVPNS
jgi:hypothetical protein